MLKDFKNLRPQRMTGLAPVALDRAWGNFNLYFCPVLSGGWPSVFPVWLNKHQICTWQGRIVSSCEDSPYKKGVILRIIFDLHNLKFSVAGILCCRRFHFNASEIVLT